MAEAVSMSDSIRSAMKEVAAAQPQEPEPVEREIEPELQTATEAEQAERARDQSGRFAKSDQPGDKRETLTLKGKPNAAEKPERQDKPAQQVAQGVGKPAADANGGADRPANPGANATGNGGTHVAPPPHWNGAAKIDWNKIPASLRESIAKDYESVGKAQTITAALAPHEATFTREFGSTDRALASILGTWNHARTQPVDFLRQFMQHYRIDPQSLGGVGQPVQGQAQEQQDDDPYGQRFQRIETALQQIAQQPVVHQQNQIQSNIQSFQTALAPDGAVAHPYFNDVRSDMGVIMQSPRFAELINTKGEQAALKEAYETACWANPNVRAAKLREQQTADEANRRQAIERAQSAAVSVSGAPGVSGAQPQAAQSVSAELRSVYRAAKGGRA